MADLPEAPCVYTYSRVSDDDRRTGSCSLQWQKDKIQAWLNYHDERADDEQIDNGVSGSILLEKRPKGKLLVAQATERGDKIVVAKRDRIFRDVEDFRARLRVWTALGVELIVLDDGLDTSTLMGRFCATIIVAAAELERGLAQERITAAIATRKEHGLRSAVEPRYGWRFVPFGPARKDGSQECRVEPDHGEQWTVRRIVHLREQFMSLRDIAEELNRGKHQPRRGGKWSHSSVQGILDNIDLHLAPPPTDAEVIGGVIADAVGVSVRNGGRP